MTWLSHWRGQFDDEPSESVTHALNELSRLNGADDPTVTIAMFLYRQFDLAEQHGATFRMHAGEFERASAVLRDDSVKIAEASGSVTKATSFVTTQVGKVANAVGDLERRVGQLIEEVDESEYALHAASEAMRTQNFWWRPDLKLVMAITVMACMVATAVMAFILYRTPAMSVETAAIVLVGSAAAPNLVELHQRGDLKALLDCNGGGWQKKIGYCQPVGGTSRIRGWNIEPSASPVERAAPFEQK